MPTREDLLAEAASLGITHHASIGEAKLQEKINHHYESKESSGATIKSLVEANTGSDITGAGTSTKKEAYRLKVSSRSKAARRTRVVKIVDNDQRQNNYTTTCTVNCSNEHFDLGTRVLPLNESIEVAQGHIDVLKEVMITLHTRNPQNGLSAAKSRNRYSISYEENHV